MGPAVGATLKNTSQEHHDMTEAPIEAPIEAPTEDSAATATPGVGIVEIGTRNAATETETTIERTGTAAIEVSIAVEATEADTTTTAVVVVAATEEGLVVVVLEGEGSAVVTEEDATEV